MFFNDTTVQRTFYYAAGMPMPESLGRSKQPNLYNGKEYEQVHGFDVYDFGASCHIYATARNMSSCMVSMYMTLVQEAIMPR